MPYARKRYGGNRRKRTTYNKWRAGGAAAGGMAFKAYRLATKLARFVNTEFKYIPTNFALSTSQTGMILPLSLIAEGDTEISRNGLSIKPMHLTGRLQITPSATGATTATTLRCIIFKGKFENGVAPVLSDILDNGSQLWLAAKDHDNRFNTKILADFFMTCNPNGTIQSVKRINKKLFGHTNYNGSAATQLEIDNGGYYLGFVSNNTAALSPLINGDFRITFADN